MLGHVSTPGPITVAEGWVLPVAIFGHILTGCQVCYPEVGDKVLAEKKERNKQTNKNRATYLWRLRFFQCCFCIHSKTCLNPIMGFALRFTLARNPKAARTNSDPIVVVVFCNYYDVILITSKVLCSSVVYDRLSCGKELCLSCRLLYCSCPLYSPLCIVGTRMNE